MVRWLMKYCSWSYSSFIYWNIKTIVIFRSLIDLNKISCERCLWQWQYLLLVSIPFLSKYQETLRILEISICKYDKVLCLSWCGNIFEVHFKTGTLILFDDKSLGIIPGRVSGDGCWGRAGLHIGWHDSWHAECRGEGKLLKYIFTRRFTLPFNQVTHNWTEIILAFTFTVTVVLIFVL